MKIAFFVYPWAFQSPGGGEILLLKTKEALEKKGVSVTLFDQWHDKLKDFDILHVFGSVKDCLGLMETAKSAKVKVVLSPIFWSSLQRSIQEYANPLKKTAMVLRHLAKVICPQLPSSRRKMFLLADALLPNSHAEFLQVQRLFAVDKSKMHVVYLGVDEKFASATPHEFIAKYGAEDFILSVGRIEPRKNQLNLIKAVKNLAMRTVFIGSPVIGYEDYYQALRRLAGERAIFINHLDHGSGLLASAYAAARVFVLQGWFETPGLVAIEAGLAGARLALTACGSTKEYFKEHARYFNPASPRSIKQAIEQSLSRENKGELKKHILDNFLWSRVAEENINAYRKVLK